MNLDTIEVPLVEARAKVAEYVKAVRERHHYEDEAILRGYRAIARGQKVISLSDALMRGGWDDRGRPRLAIAKAEMEWVWLHTITAYGMADEGRRKLVFSEERFANAPRGRTFTKTIPVEVTAWARGMAIDNWRGDARAIVPSVPPALRPARGLGKYHVLFEAEWQPVPPKDPALLRHIGGDLWAVIATWDLSDLEMAVLAGRSRRDS